MSALVRYVGCSILGLVACGWSVEALAYAPPTAKANGICVTIVGLDQGPRPAKVDRDRRKINVKIFDATNFPPIVVAVSNGSPKTVTGDLAVWMNEDWTVASPTAHVALASGEARDFIFKAQALPTVLPALYPIHAQLTTATTNLHPIAVFRACTTNRAFSTATMRHGPLTCGRWRLDEGFPYSVGVQVKGRFWTLDDPSGADPESRGVFRPTGRMGTSGTASRKIGFAAHPPYANGAGEVMADFPLTLPAQEKVNFRFATALSDVGKPRNPGDGVTVRVLVKDAAAADFVELYRRHMPESGCWHPAAVDLSAYAGRAIVLRLAGDPGPKNNTVFDSHAWGDLFLDVGDLPSVPTEAGWRVRETMATDKAKRALRGVSDPEKGVYRLETRGVAYGAGVVLGPAGILDAVLAFTDGERTVVQRGFEVELDGQPLLCCVGRPDVQVDVSAEKGTLKVAWRTVVGESQLDGGPRLTRVAAGPVSLPAQRVYLGTGNVWENLKAFTFRNSGFVLSTRHVGMDFANGLSLVQATDVPPDEFEVNASNRLARLVAHNDVTFMFTPSAKGAFDAAVRFADASGYRASPGIGAMKDRICIDDWSGQYRREGEALRRAKKYGLDDVLYIQHNWQRWGYDARLPEVYPPRGNFGDFMEMRQAAKEVGYLFAIHDNYVDFYPDAEGYSHRLFAFNPDGTPLEAWYNPGIRSLSYRWLPAAIHPRLKANLALQRKGFHPEALFIDVFTASAARDTYDYRGHFTSVAENLKEWCWAWCEAREVYGVSNAVMVSEAASDSQIGYVDAGEADHYSPRYVAWGAAFADGERVPWHDAVSHGKMLLFGGGLGGRYANDDPRDRNAGDRELHGYGSDDYLCTTVIGGRVPMGPSFGRITARTYWMLHDVCGQLGRMEFSGLAFCGDNLHRQQAVFAGGGVVWANRETNAVWRLDGGHELPTYGFHAKAGGGFEAAVETLDGIRVGWSSGPGYRFVDARPPSRGQKGDAKRLRALGVNAARRMVDFGGIVTDGAFLLSRRSTTTFRLTPLPDSVPFRAILDLSALQAAGREVQSVGSCELEAKGVLPAFIQNGDRLELACDGLALAYDIRLQ
ncbi:MAG: hypothetical protein MJ240_05700 [Kiritimatiellae bacterium]|nr:hypothetical protein [Kiritimatiellia bacterium]